MKRNYLDSVVFCILNIFASIHSSMTCYVKGIPLLGTWRGKLGEMVFTRRAGEQIARTRNRNIKNPQTYAQAIQRSRLAALLPIFRLINGAVFGRLKIGWSQYNSFVSRNLTAARPTRIDNGTGTQYIYEADYPFLTPPTPKTGHGNGLSVMMPLIVTQGTLNQPTFGICPQERNQSFSLVLQSIQSNGINVNLLNTSSVSLDGICFGIHAPGFTGRAISVLTSIGIDAYEAYNRNETIELNGKQAEWVINAMVSGNRHVHTGFLLVMDNQGDGVAKTALYNEIGDIVESTVEIDIAEDMDRNLLFAFTGFMVNSRGEKFTIYADAIGVGANQNLILIRLDSMPYITDSAVDGTIILSRKRKGSLLLSKSQLLQSATTTAIDYQTLFTAESIDEAARDYQKAETQSNGLNLDLNGND